MLRSAHATALRVCLQPALAGQRRGPHAPPTHRGLRACPAWPPRSRPRAWAASATSCSTCSTSARRLGARPASSAVHPWRGHQVHVLSMTARPPQGEEIPSWRGASCLGSASASISRPSSWWARSLGQAARWRGRWPTTTSTQFGSQAPAKGEVTLSKGDEKGEGTRQAFVLMAVVARGVYNHRTHGFVERV
eukprot:SAG11_NODE_4113_length_2059_cov_8.459685_1_plen_192_part_00